MPFNKKTVIINFADVSGRGGLTKFTDVDDGNREVPVNMNYISEGFLAKDTGVTTFGTDGASMIKRLINFKKKSGVNYFIRLNGGVLEKYNITTLLFEPIQAESAVQTGTVATIAPTAGTGTLVTSGTAVTGTGTAFTPQLTANVSYITVGGKVRLVTAIADATHCTIASAFDVDITTTTAFTFGTHILTGTGTAFNTAIDYVGQVIRVGTEIFTVLSIASATSIVVDHNPIATASGIAWYKNSAYVFDTSALMGYVQYSDVLYLGNGVNDFATFDGTTLKFYPGKPRGNIYEAFEDRIFMSGTLRDPLAVYYSDINAPTTYQTTSVINLLGPDIVTGLVNYHGNLVIFKRNTVWKVSFVYEPLAAAYILKPDLINGGYGCASKQGYAWVEDQIWFFTGQDVRSVGLKDQQFGVLGVDATSLSEDIKETLKVINQSKLTDAKVFYNNHVFYLSVASGGSSYNDKIYCSHLLYSNKWTKYTGRIKNSVSDFIEVDDIIYSASGDVTGRIYKWSTSEYFDSGASYACYVTFRKYESKDFSQRKIWRNCDLQFQNLEAICDITIYADDFDARTFKGKSFSVGSQLENEENSLGEVDWGESLWGDAFGESISATSFVNRRISFLSKSQDIQIKVGNSVGGEKFTITQYALVGYIQPRNQYAPDKIITI